MTSFKRSPELDVKKLRPGEYIQYKHIDVWALYKCPRCGFVTSLGKKVHDVYYDGTVTPAAACPHALGSGTRCAFSDSITLEEWIPEAKGSA